MKQQIQTLITQSLDKLLIDNIISEIPKAINVNHTKDKTHGDYATNIAMVLTKQAKMPPKQLAQKILENLPESKVVEKVNIAGAGFINFFVQSSANNSVIEKILEQKDDFGRATIGKGQKILLEFVSANPTGPLHVGHGRGAALGATVANLLTTVGFDVDSEYYVNDAGRQMDILATSVYLRYVETDKFPDNGYKGDYIYDIAKKISGIGKLDIFTNVRPDEKEGGDKEQHIDDLIENCKNALKGDYKVIFDLAINTILANIKTDLSEFGVNFNQYFSEQSLTDSKLNDKVIKQLKISNHLYEKDGALWFKTTAFDDEKDRVVVRDNGLATYFASDIAYHYEKFNRGYDKVINIWGADHHGYIARVKASIKALGFDEKKLEILLVQFATLYRGKEQVPMSTRSGSFVTLKELREEVGNDATRFFYILRKSDQHMDFDLELAKSQTNDNPVFYIQYAHARICRVFEQAEEKNLSTNTNNIDLALLDTQQEVALIKTLNKYQESVETAALNYEPHVLAYYLRKLATDFHSYYNASVFLEEDEKIRHSRLALIKATQQVLKNGLKLLGVSAPISM
jgi:arginyl-tRNA synthetase